MCGDFNMPHINWTNVAASCDNHTATGILSNLILKHAFMQLVREPTRVDEARKTANLLDLVFCNDCNFIYNTNVIPPFSTSDHCMVSFDILAQVESSTKSSTTYDFSRADWSSIADYLNRTDIVSSLFEIADVNEQFNYFYEVITDCIANHVPIVKNRSSNRKNYYPPYVDRLLRKKATAWRVYKHFRTDESLRSYKKCASECRGAIYKHAKAKETKIVNSGNPSAFDRYCNRRFTNRSLIGPIRMPDSQLFTVNPDKKADIFQDFFVSSYTKDNNIIPNTDHCGGTTHKISSISFNPYYVNKAIKRLKPKAKGGPDQLSPLFIKKCSLWLAPALALLFQRSFDTGFFPAIWALSYVTPIFKSGDRADVGNYRPIALTCVMCKLMESIIKDQLLQYLLNSNLINKDQHAFIKKHSTAGNLLECTNDWGLKLNLKRCVDVIYIDYKKAFDSIVHTKLLVKLQSFGIEGRLLAWISSFLANRTQRVVVENCFSAERSVQSGVIQGSVLGPILFLLYVNDVSSTLQGNVQLKLFADDLKIYTSIDADISHTHASELQSCLDSLCDWSKAWQLTINSAKCSILSLHSRKNCCSHDYYVDGNRLPNQSKMKDLGITVDDKLTFKDHINKVVTDANRRVCLLFRGFVCKQPTFLRRAYITYIRPLLEYNTIIWNPSLKKYIDLIENVQRKFTKRIPGLENLAYEERLGRLNLESLEIRRLRSDLVYYHKIFLGVTPHAVSDFFTLRIPPSQLRRSTSSIIKPVKASNGYLSSFRFRSVDAWNALPEKLKQSKTINEFKTGLKCVDLSAFLYGRGHTHLHDFSNIIFS